MLFGICIWFFVAASSLASDDAGYARIMQQGREAIDSGHAEAAAIMFRAEIDKMLADHVTLSSLLPMRIALATAYIESGELRLAEENLMAASRTRAGTGNAIAMATLSNAWGVLHLKQGHYEQAREEFADGLNRISETPDGRRLKPTLLDNLAAAEIHTSLYEQAVRHQREALSRWETWQPPEPVKLMQAYIGLAAAQYLSDNADAAEASMLTAIDSARVVSGARSPLMADLLESQSVILRRLGRKREARAALAEARQIRPATTATSPTYTIDVKTLMRPPAE